MKKNNKNQPYKGDKRENKADPKDAAKGNLQENPDAKSGLNPEQELRKSQMDVQMEGDTRDRDFRDDVGNTEDGPAKKSSDSTGHSQTGTSPHSDNH